MVLHVSPWGVHCGIAKHLSYWLPHLRVPSAICAEIKPAWHKVVETWGDVPCTRAWTRGSAHALADVAAMADSLGANIVHWQWDPSFFPFRAMEEYERWVLKTGTRTVVTAHVLYDDDLFTWENKKMLTLADQLVVGTPHMVNAFAEYAERYQVRLYADPRCVCLPAPRIPGLATRRSKRRGVHIGTWGFTGGHKGHAEIADAVQMLSDSGTPAKYIVAGRALTGEQRETVERLRNRPNVEVREGFLTDEQVYKFCRSLDCVVLNHRCHRPSSSGTVALSVASGTPVVVSESPMFSGYSDTAAVKVASPGAEGIAAAIAAVLRDPTQLDSGRKTMLKRNDPAAVARQYEDIYSEVAA